MSGKSYTLREMKGIVDYLIEHGAYSEIRGRKMWMDFASSRLTSRTWQSLKETFLKRILPDITNPYYKLNVEQIQSFKREVDLIGKDKNKLEFQPVGEESSHEDPKGDNGQPSTSKSNNEENGTGEDTTCSKIVHNRASTETLILENCYETAEDIQRDLEKSTDEEQETEKPKSKSTVKSLRDFIVYTEPLTPLLQEVLDDFATDASSDREPAMEIDEDYVSQERRSKSPGNIEQSQSILHPQVTSSNVVITKDCKDKEETTKDAIENHVTENHMETEKNTEEANLSQDDVMVLVDEALAKELECELNSQKIETQVNVQESNEVSSAMTDTLLPNNQEAINRTSPEDHAPAKPSPDTDEASNKRKHSNSVEIIENSKKINMDFDKLISNTDAINETKSPCPIEVDSPIIEKNKTEILKKKHNLRLNTSKSSNIPSQLSISSKDSKLRKNEKVHKVNSDSSSSNNNPSSSKVVNPCLKSVSLYAEQFSSTKYSDSDLNVIEEVNDQKKVPTIKSNQEEEKEVILLRSFSTSDSDEAPTSNHKPQSSIKVQKDKKLASLFGFTNDGVNKNRRLSGRKRTISHRSHHYDDYESSEWTSASDSDYVSPPRGRRNRHARKYLKPNSARVMSLEEGGLFVMLGKKIYPLVKDGHIVKNYLTYMSESDPEEDDSYWKAKYVEERKRTAELKKLVKESKQNEVCELISEAEKSPTPITPLIPNQQQQATTSKRDSANDNESDTGYYSSWKNKYAVPEGITIKEFHVDEVTGETNTTVARNSHSIVKPSPDKTVKIKFSKNDQEVLEVEGHWQHINPVLAQVVAMFHKEPVSKSPDAVNCVELSSGMTTPIGVDAGVQEKINKMESDIFQEIKEKDDKDVEMDPTEKQESNSEVAENQQSNVTTRRKRGRPKKETPAVASSSKKTKESTSEPEAKLSDVEKVQQVKETPSVSSSRKTRTPRKLLDGVTNLKEVKTRKSSPANEIEIPKADDEEVLYKFPSPPPETRGRKSKTSLSKTAKETAKKHTQPITSPDSLSRHSVNSSQGYQDSDASPFHIGVRRKRRLSVSTLSYKTKKSQRRFRSKSYPLVQHVTSESSNSSFSVSVKTVMREQSTLNSEVYRSESFQHLMPRSKSVMQRLPSIDEGTTQERDLDVTTKNNTERGEAGIENDVGTTKNDVASSSNLSLPPSPELSIVEDLSITRSALEAIKDFPTINETQNDIVLNTFANKYLMSHVDVSMPLMTQECGLEESYRRRIMSALNTLSELKDKPTSAGHASTNESGALKLSSISETILREIGAATRDASPSDSLDKRLEQLLLESVKKPNNPEKMEVDTVVKKKSGSRKRCSTPNKKTIQKKGSKVPNEGALVEEESQARCSHSGRRSCPPSINIVYYEDNAPDNLQIDIHEKSVDVTTITKRKSVKKDVIKVKILRPKDKPQQKRKSPKVQNVSQTSNVECDESRVFLQGFDDSAGLIHNHSETCLQIRDCLEDSVEIIETTSKSVISLDSSDEIAKENLEPNIIITEGKDTLELFCENAQFECENLCGAAKRTDSRSPESENTCYFTPLMSKSNSILTEDLSDEPPVPRRPNSRTTWHLVDEEETNYYDAYQENVPSYSVNLKQLFPIACAVPNLSTITESSERNSRPSFEEE